jgi:hypothetical protein
LILPCRKENPPGPVDYSGHLLPPRRPGRARLGGFPLLLQEGNQIGEMVADDRGLAGAELQGRQVWFGPVRLSTMTETYLPSAVRSCS